MHRKMTTTPAFNMDALCPGNVNVMPVKTGIAIELPPCHVGLIRDRSSYGVRGIVVTAGVIDPDYRGEIIICLANLNPFEIILSAGAKVAQMLVMPTCCTAVEIVESLSTTDRGGGGFGSSGE
jgi:dUTP pyrophosphatase